MSTSVKKQLKITLRSDLICGSGIGWGNVVDTDVVYDDLGFPYIPARRLRGLLKEALWELEQFGFHELTSTELFGDEENEGHLFKIYNARLANIHHLRKEVTMLNLNAIDVLTFYTTIRYQTSIDNDGIALDNSLRSVRAIKKGITFYADLECEVQDLAILKKCCTLIKHMGTNRTRGFGEVTLTIEDAIKTNNINLSKIKDDREYLVKLCLRNLTQLSLTSTQGEKSLDYINGSSILGFFANKYLKTHCVDRRFYELFVDGNVKFHNAYVTDSKYNMSFPVRESLFKEKTGDMYFDKLIYQTNNQNEPIIMKKVHDKYLVKENVMSSEKEIVYHHRRPLDKSIGHSISNETIEDGGFYQLEVLSPNQRFVSFIQGKGKDIKEILANCPPYLQIGKSKSTQYGNVEIETVEVNEFKPKVIKAGTEVLCTLLSPMIILNEKQEASLTKESLLNVCNIENDDNTNCYVGYSEIGGFNAKWKLQKPSYYAFSKGTCVRGVLTHDVHEYQYVGSMQQEGNGVVYYETLKNNDNGSFVVNKKEQKFSHFTPKYAKNIYVSYLKNQVYLELLEIVQNEDKPTINNTTLNKMIKTLEQNSLLDVKQWLDEKNEKSKDKKEAKLQQQNDKFKELKAIIEDIEVVCNEQVGISGLGKLMDKKEKEVYLEELYVTMVKHYLLHFKRGGE